ncbi:MAG: pilus assembly protein PilQ [Nevskia sp.]|nr:pilus assembly protein PilQ [Nevskia sp.]
MRFSRFLGKWGTSVLRRMPRPAATIALALLALAVSGAHAEQVRSLQAVDFVALDGDRVLLTLTLSDIAPQPVVFSIDKPARLSVDLPETHLALAERYRKINVGKVRAVGAAEAQGRTRVVVELSDMTPYTTRVDGNKVYVELAGASGALSGAIPQTAGTAPRVQPATVAPTIADIDFRRGEKGEGRVLVTLNDPHTPVDVREEGGKIIARFKNTTLPERLAKRLDVLDFATPAKFVDAVHDGANTDIVVTPINGGDFEQTGYQTGNQFVLELQPLSQEKLDQRKREQPLYTGERISLSFQSVDIRSLLQIIADVAGSNMVVSDSVNGQIAMRLQNVPWDQALDIILRTKGLGMRQQGNVMLVAPLEELAQREKIELESEKQKVQLAPLRSELIQVNYAKASDLAALMKSKDNTLLSERGNVTVDERTNTLLVLETRDKLAEIRALVQRLDIPVRQVLIESRIVVANDNYNRQLGVQFGVTGAGTSKNGNLITTSGTNTATNTAVNGYLNQGRTGSVPVNSNANGERYNINLPITGAAGSIGLAILTKNFLVDLELQALQSEGRGQVVSSPHVITANAKQASIEQGVEIPYQQNAGGTVGGTSIAFKKAVLSLNVTPQITPDDRVIMDLEVSNDTRGQDVNTGGGGVAPSIDTRKVNTQVLVDNGQTVVLGGIYEQTLTDSVTKVPLLGDIPYLGVLFRTTNHTNNKSELLVFITPKILNESLNIGQ